MYLKFWLRSSNCFISDSLRETLVDSRFCLILSLLADLGIAATPLWLRKAISTWAGVRSEEHTSELQSRENLVCRLLLEKKKKYIQLRESQKSQRLVDNVK